MSRHPPSSRNLPPPMSSPDFLLPQNSLLVLSSSLYLSVPLVLSSSSALPLPLAPCGTSTPPWASCQPARPEVEPLASHQVSEPLSPPICSAPALCSCRGLAALGLLRALSSIQISLGQSSLCLRHGLLSLAAPQPFTPSASLCFSLTPASPSPSLPPSSPRLQFSPTIQQPQTRDVALVHRPLLRRIPHAPWLHPCWPVPSSA